MAVFQLNLYVTQNDNAAFATSLNIYFKQNYIGLDMNKKFFKIN